MAQKPRVEFDHLAKTYRQVAQTAQEIAASLHPQAVENRRIFIQDLLNQGGNPLSKEKKTR